jgi:hypothetical protein
MISDEILSYMHSPDSMVWILSMRLFFDIPTALEGKGDENSQSSRY